MKKFITVILILVLATSFVSYATANESSDSEIVVLTLAPTPTPKSPLQLPESLRPTPKPELPKYEYMLEDARCISRAIWSATPKHPTRITKLAFAEVVQNMVDDGRYKEDIRHTLLMKSEFPSYDPDAHRSSDNDTIADYAMRSWAHAAETGDRSYRLTPANGLRYAFYNRGGLDYIVVYDWEWNAVYDSGEQ